MNRRHFLLTGAAAALAQSPKRPVNIVMIYADDIGFGDLSCYGATRVKTPNLDRIAQEGIRFTNQHASSATCTPSRYSLLTGEYAWRRPGTSVLPGNALLIIDPERPTLPSMLKQQGYTTGVVGKWHLGLGKGNIDWNGEIKPGPNEIGFDYSFLLPATGDRVPCVYTENGRVVGLDPKDPIQVDYAKPIGDEPLGKTRPDLLKMHPSHGHDMAIVNGVSRIGYMTGGKSALWVDEDMADTLTRKATSFIERSRSKPFFLFFATHDIHVPRVPHPRFKGRTPMGPRGDAIAELDWSVGEILAALEKTGHTRDTLVMFSSDNGPVIDDGYKDDAVEKLGDHKPAGPLRGGKYSNFDAGTRVPFVLRWPDRVKPRQTSNALLSQLDLYASLASLTGHKLADNAAPDSFDTHAALLGETQQGRPYVIEHASSMAVIEGDWKYIQPHKGPAVNKNTNTEMGHLPAPQLYNLAKDLGEKNNVAAEHPERVQALADLLAKVRAQPRSRP